MKKNSIITLLIVLNVIAIKVGFGQHNFSKSYTNENLIFDFIEIGNDTILAFTINGYYKFQNTTEIDTSFFNPKYKNTTELFTSITKQNDSTIWMGGNGKLYRMYKYIIEEIEFPSTETIYDLDFDSNENLWIGTWGGGLYKFDGLNWHNYTKSANGLTDDRVTSIYIDDRDSIWIGYHMNGIGLVSSNDSIYNYGDDDYFNSPFDVSEIILNDSISYICGWDGLYAFWNNKLRKLYDSDPIESIAINNDTIWLASYDNGILKIHVNDLNYNNLGWDIDESKFEKVKNNLLTDYPTKIIIDRFDKKWIGSFNGINYYNSNWNLIMQNSIGNDRIDAIRFDSSGNKWICTYRGLSLLSESVWTNFQHPSLKNQIIHDIYINNDTSVWVCAGDSIINFLFNNSTKTLHKIMSFEQSVRSITGNNDTIYFGSSRNGLLRYYNNQWDTINTDNGLISNSILKVEIQGSIIWVVTLPGISKIDKNAIINYNCEIDIPVRTVYDIAKDTNNCVWFSCSGGVLKYEDEDFVFYPTDSQYDYINNIGIDTKNNIWVSINRETSLLKEQNHQLIKVEVNDNWYSYDANDIVFDDSGNIWFGTSRGIYIINKDKILPSGNINLSVKHIKCLDSLTVTASSPGYIEIYDFNFINNDNTKQKKVNDSTLSVYNIPSKDLKLQVRGVNRYFKGEWSDTLEIELDKIPQKISLSTTICEGDSAFINGEYWSNKNTFYDTLTSDLGCDSIIILELLVGQSYLTTQKTTLCEGDSILFGGKYCNTTGLYIDTLKSIMGCDSIVNMELNIDICLDTKPIELQNGLKVFPNPVQNELTIYIKQDSENVKIIIYDFQGKILYLTKVNGQVAKINMERFEAGFYIISLQSDKFTLNKKILKIN